MCPKCSGGPQKGWGHTQRFWVKEDIIGDRKKEDAVYIKRRNKCLKNNSRNKTRAQQGINKNVVIKLFAC
jgi:hypothetical protein